MFILTRRLSTATPYARASSLLPLPPTEQRITLPPTPQWRKHWTTTYASVRDRTSVSNPNTAALLADSLVPEGSKNKVIIEAFPGIFVDMLTRSSDVDDRARCADASLNGTSKRENAKTYCNGGTWSIS